MNIKDQEEVEAGPSSTMITQVPIDDKDNQSEIEDAKVSIKQEAAEANNS